MPSAVIFSLRESDMFDFSSEKSNVKVNFSLAEQASPGLKVLIKLFQKFADSKGGALVAPAGAKFFLQHFLFAKHFHLQASLGSFACKAL